MIPQHQDMLNACTTGDLAALRHLFEARNIKCGSKPVYISSPDDPPPADEMIAAAIANGHLGIVLFILHVYEGISFGCSVITALIYHPNMAIMEALYKYDNGIVQFEWDDNVSTFVTEACKQPPEKITHLLHFLVEHDACLDTGGMPFTWAVHAAICGNQTVDVIEAMMEKGGPVTIISMRQAIVCERVDVIDSFIRFGVKGQRDDIQGLLTAAEETGDAGVIKSVHVWTSSWKNDGSKASGSQTVVQKVKQLFNRRS